MFGGNRSSIPYLKMACVWPPQTSISLSGLEVIRAISAASFCATPPSRNSSTYFILTCLLQRRFRAKTRQHLSGFVQGVAQAVVELLREGQQQGDQRRLVLRIDGQDVQANA